MSLFLSLLLKLLSSEATKTLIAISINKLLESKKDGITNNVAKVMIDGITKSKSNPTTEDLFSDAIDLLNTKNG